MKLCNTIIQVAILLGVLVYRIRCISATDVVIRSNRTERAMLFPASSTVGIFAAIAVPLHNIQHDVFVSYNFEANYNSPGLAEDFTRPLEKYDIPETRKQQKRSAVTHIQRILTRSRMYRLMENKFTAYGFDGHPCLLRMICEAAESPLGIANGVLGDFLHVILTPSSSQYEQLPDIYYEAEIMGTMQLCQMFHHCCPVSVMDVISIF